MISKSDVSARVRRLEELTRGLSKEVAIWKEGNDPLLYLERKSYLNAIQDALAGVEAARVVMARAAQRIQKDPGKAEPEVEKNETESGEADESRQSA